MYVCKYMKSTSPPLARAHATHALGDLRWVEAGATQSLLRAESASVCFSLSGQTCVWRGRSIVHWRRVYHRHQTRTTARCAVRTRATPSAITRKKTPQKNTSWLDLHCYARSVDRSVTRNLSTSRLITCTRVLYQINCWRCLNWKTSQMNFSVHIEIANIVFNRDAVLIWP